MGKFLGAALREARKAKKMTLKDIAAAVGVSYPAVQQWESGKTDPSFDNLRKVCGLLGVDLHKVSVADTVQSADLSNIFLPGEVVPVIPNTDLSKAEDAPPLHSFNGPRNVPVLGTVAGGKRGDADFRLNGETIDYAPRPPGIANKKDVYVLGVTGESMEPKFEEGERVYVDPHRSPSIMDYVVIQVLAEEEGDSHDGFIKRLVRRTPTKIVVSQFNPPREIEFDRDEVKVHRVIPQDELLGV